MWKIGKMRKQTSNCSAIRERIFGSNGVLDRECAGHCVQCADCRRELAALLRAQQSSPQIPSELDRRILRAAEKSPFAPGYVRRILIPAAAGVLLCLTALPLLRSEAPVPARTWSDEAWEGTELKQQLALMDQSLRTEEFWTGGAGE